MAKWLRRSQNPKSWFCCMWSRTDTLIISYAYDTSLIKFGSPEQVWVIWPSLAHMSKFGQIGSWDLPCPHVPLESCWDPMEGWEQVWPWLIPQWYIDGYLVDTSGTWMVYNGVQWCTMNVYEMMWVVCLHMPRLLWMALKVKWTQEIQICCFAKWFWWQKSKWQKCSFHHRDAFMSFPLGLWVIEHVWATGITNNDMSSRPSGNGIGFVKVTPGPRIIKVCYQHW